VVEVGPDQTREVRMLITVHEPTLQGSKPITVRIVDLASGQSAAADDHFRGPEGESGKGGS
jgi:hypothetical protein